ncbi:MAG: ExeM/NucH family extracellular endonuclease, partial [Gloeotrichia echinulata HAB0833]
MAATTLTAGDIAIVGYINNGSPDSFSFVNLVTIGSGTVIYFTDNGWTASGFRGVSASDADGNENLIKFTANADIPSGTVIRTSDTTSSNFTWTTSGTIVSGVSGSYASLALASGSPTATNGDQIAAVQSTGTNPLLSGYTAIFQIDYTGAFEDATTSNQGNLISGLSQTNNTAVLFNNAATYAAFNLNTLTSATKAQWLAAINNSSNWTFGSSTALPTGTITVSSGIPTVNLSLSSNTGTEAGTTVITVTATASSAVSGNQTVNLGVSGTGITTGDYNLSNTTITILSGQTTSSVTFTVVDDALVEGTETATLTISSPSSGITLGNTTSQNIAITDNDTAGITVTPTSGLTTTEAGATASFTVVLTSQPTANVTIALSSANTAEGTVSPTSLTFTAANWNTAQTVTLTGVDDQVADGNIAYNITGTASSSDSNYQGRNFTVNATNIDNDTAGVTIIETNGATNVTEGGATDSYSVKLNTAPTANVTITLTPNNAQVNLGAGAGTPTTLTFTAANWNVAQTVTVTAVDDAVVEGNHSSIITHTASSSDSNYNNISIAAVTANITDNDTAGVTITQSGGSTDVTEGGATDTYTVVLNTQPTANVTIAVAGTQTTTSPTTLTFTAANWNVAQTVTVTAVDDAVAQGNHTGTITHTATSSDSNYNNISIASVTANITDNDFAPTIQESATTTTFLNLPATGSGAISGVINDPTDPAKTLGIDFAIADADTAVGNLTVTATSSNTAVVTNANLTITGSGATRNLKINPTGVGYADITVTVSDGTNSNAYTINYAASAAGATTSRFLTGASNASTAVVIDTNYMVVGDDENQVLRLYDRHNSGLAVAGFDYTASLGLTDISGGVPREVDLEASTTVGNRIFWLGSQSNSDSGNSRPNRDRVFGTDISGTGASTSLSYVGRYDYLREDIIAWDVNNSHGKGANYYGLSASAAAGVGSKQSSGYNIEGLEMAPDNTTAYIAFRAPQEPTGTRSKALIVPVTNFTSLLSANGGTQGSATFGAPIELDLGGRGIREIRKNASNQYVIIAGPAGEATGVAPNDFRLYTWTGNASDAPVLRAADLTSLNASGSFESIVEVPNSLTSTSQLQLLVDNGDTVYYNDGKIAKDVAANYQKSRSEIVTLGSAIVTLPAGTISLNTPYSQNFDSLSSSNATWTDNTTLTGWYAAYTSSTLTTITAGTGSSNTGSLYSFGASGSTERALGSVASGTPGTINYGARFYNDTGATISSLSVSYIGEEWRNGGNTTKQKLDFAYQIGASSISSGTWTDVDSLDFTSPIATSTAAALNGNDSANRVSLSSTLTGFSLAPGQEIWLRWSDVNDAGNDHGLAIDNLQVSTSALAGVTIAESSGSTNVTEGGATDTYTVVLNTQPTANVIITIAPDSQTTTSATTLTFTSANWNIAQTVTVTAVDDTAIEGTHSSTITHTASSSDSNYNGVSVSSVTATITDNDVATVITKIHDIQGSGSTFNSAFSGTRTIEGIVVAAFAGSTKLNGFYVQEEDADADADSTTSEAIFIYDPSGKFSGNVGDKVRVTGTVAEFTSTSSGNTSSLTQLSNVTTVVNLGASTLPTVTNIQLPVTSVTDLERYEGMLVNVSAASGNLTVTEYFQLGRFGQVLLSATGASNQPGTDARLDQYTQFNAPSVSGYSAYLADIAKREIYLDDGSGTQNPDPIIFGRGGNPLSASNTLRGGDTVTSITGVLDQRFEGYRVQTSTGVNFTPTNPRPTSAPDVGGSLKVASFNVLNYFNDLDTGSNITTNGLTFQPRGAETATEFTRQRDKIIQAIIGSGADVLGLMELENNGYGSTSAIQNLVNGLNAVAGAGTYTFINPGTSLGTDAIAVGLIYKPGKVTPVGAAATMPNGYGTGAFDLVGRKPLAQTFQQISTGEKFTAVVNHFKSKGSSAGGVGDADAGDGQGFSNGTRTRQAQDLAQWLATKPTGTTDSDYLVLGDLNAYAKEDPLTTLAGAGYNSLVSDTSYSYVFDGQLGSLDHALATNSLATQVTGADKWHINADEPSVLDYNTNFKSTGQVSSLYNADQYRASDHDPVIVGLNLNTAPVAGNDTATTNEDTAININVLANDSDVNGDVLQLSLVSAPVNGTATVNNNGTTDNFADDFIIYTPNSNYNGSDSFTYSINDGKGKTATATVNVTITSVNDPAIISGNVTGAVTEDAAQ